MSAPHRETEQPRPAPPGAASTLLDAIRAKERALAAGLAAARRAADERLVAARAEAASIVALARAEATRAEEEGRRATLDAARAEAARIAEEGARAAGALRAAGERLREQAIRRVVAIVLPEEDASALPGRGGAP